MKVSKTDEAWECADEWKRKCEKGEARVVELRKALVRVRRIVESECAIPIQVRVGEIVRRALGKDE